MNEGSERVEALLALILIQSFKGEPMAEKAAALSTAGFTNVEIADFLQTSPQTVTQLLYERRKKGSRKSSVSGKHRH